MQSEKFYKLTNPQRSIWLTEQFFKDTTVNNICTSGIIYENIEVEVLKEAINELVKQNDAFRTRIIMKNDIPVQYIANYEKIDIDVVSCTDEEEIKMIEEEEVKYKFEIIDSNLYKFKIALFGTNNAAVILTAHHIIGDSWSFGLTIQEILKNYHSLIEKKELEKTTSSYIEYIKSEEEYKKSEKFQKDKQYWNDLFSTIPEQATIPGLKSEGRSTSYNAKRQSFNIDKDLLKSINNFCAVNKISAFTFFMSMFSIYIGRVSNLDDIVLGTPILNRTNFKEKHTMGMFVNTVPVRISNLSDKSFKDFSGNVSKNIMGMLRHQKYSYNTLLDDLREKNKSLPNLYNIVISYQITKAFDDQIGNYTTNWTFNNYCANDLNIHIFDINDTGSLVISYDYLVDKYSEKDVADLQERILWMINQIVANPDIDCNKIDIVTPAEKDLILNVFNNTATDYPRDKSIVDLFEEIVEQYPDNIAVSFDGQELTYRELNEKANSLAHILIEKDVKTEDVVGIYLDKSLEMIIAVLAIIKVGAAYLPIDIDYPADRISYMLENSNCNIILTKNVEIPSDLLNKPIVIDISLNNKYIYNNTINNLNLNISYNNLAYIMYTSGSTGTPKGVMVEHRNIIRLVRNTNYINITPLDKILQTGSIVFDACTFEIWGALLNGAQICIIKKENLLVPASLKNFIQESKISMLWLTAPLFNKICEDDVTIFDNVNFLLTGGDVLSTKHINKLMKHNKNIQIINGYGPTENTTFSCCFPIDKQYKQAIPIGKPIANSTGYVVSSVGTLQPIGVPGELWVGGDGVSRGYLNRDDLTFKNFIDNPFSKGKIYKTGDLVSLSNNGTINFLGRIDNQVKIRGFRVELNEINLKILEYPHIKESYTTIYSNKNQKNICSYIVFTDDNFEKNLKTFLKASLPTYMIPSYIVTLDKLPLNINGKVDKNQLPEPNKEIVDKEFINPRNQLDKDLIQILSKLLNIKPISLNDTLLDLGGDSLTAITLSTKIASKYGVQLSIKDLLSNYTVKDLSDFINNNQLTPNKIIKIEKSEDRKYYPLSSAQKRIYYNSKMIGDKNIVYNISGAILIEELLDSKRIQEIFTKIINRHSILRTNFIINEDDVVQIINEKTNFKVETYNNSEADIENLLKTFSKPFDLEKDFLFRISLHFIDKKKTLMLIETHHIIMDGTGLNNLIIEFNRLYNGESLKRIPIQYKDYSIWENEFLNTELANQHEKYWLDKFKNYDFKHLNLPYDYSNVFNRSYSGRKISKLLDKTYFSKVEKYAKKMGVSPYMLFISVFYILLYKYTNQTDIVIGTPVANREINETKRMIGMFVNNIVVKGNIHSENTFMEFLQSIKNQILNDLCHQSYPFDKLVKQLGIPLNNSKNPLFDVMFTYQNQQENIIKIGNKDCQILEIKNNITKFDLSFEVCPSNNTINIEYNTSLFKQKTIERLFAHYLNIMDSILKNINIPISDINILSEVEKNKILNIFNDTNANYPKKKTIVHLFEEQAYKFPWKTAIVYNNKKYSYHYLIKQSNKLAHYLQNQGLKSNDIVGVLMDRSPEMIVSILAILKNGAAYLPIDPSYPTSRIEYILNDSKAKFLLIHKGTDKLPIISKYNSINISFLSKELKEYSSRNINFSNLNESAYLIYTSGSTGNPKGVVIGHSSLFNYIYWCKKFYCHNKAKNFPLYSSISFDLTVTSIYTPLVTAGTIVIYNSNDTLITLKEIFNDKISNIVKLTPAHLSFVQNFELKNTKVNTLIVGGDILPFKLCNNISSLNKNIKIYNEYGPTETTVGCMIHKYQSNDVNYGSVPIGRPIDNVKIYCLDKHLHPVPYGVKGEIYIGGKCLAKGYSNKKLTDERFITNPFDNTTKLYKTGDIAFLHSNNILEYIERNDSQISLNGFRIELGEIDKTLLQHPSILEAKTLVYTKNDKSYLASYFTADRKLDISNLQSYLHSKLTHYMIPKVFIQLPELPLTVNGKIDKSKLPTPVIESKKPYVAPRNDIEKKLCKIFTNLFNNKKIGIDDNFFELGGDSLSAIKLQLEAMNKNINISYANIFSSPTIRELSETLSDKTSIVKLSTNQEYDYSNFEKKLHQNTLKNIPKKIKVGKIKNVLLTGATGFLGAHILDNILSTSDNSIIYCMIRNKDLTNSEERLKKILNFYFNDKYEKEFGKRIKIVPADITIKNFGLTLEQYNALAKNINIVIHSAALVKHYGTEDDFYISNVIGTKNIINFCKEFNKKLYHISTASVSGMLFNKSTHEISFNESNLYIGQELNNIYIKTKFEAEKLIFENINQGLKATIFRLGNISNRYTDAKFQINLSENAFVNKIKSLYNLGIIQKKLQNTELEFAPVDLCANAIVKIIKSNPKFSVFHICNNQYVKIKDFAKTAKLKLVTDDIFSNTIKEYLNNPELRNSISGLITDLNSNKLFVIENNVFINSNFTNAYLNKLNFNWPNIDNNYIEKYINYFKEIKYFN
ncbi:MAG: amino acid adenylation domain-containing protein [Clostridia bacterium]|nr:amino acid adenylation domain-containing protein [Clostridia bacterium]